MKCKSEMGQRLLKLFEFELGFLRIRETAAILRRVGAIPVESEEWMMAVMRGSSEERQDLTRTVGFM